MIQHIKNIYPEGELDEISTCRKFRQVRREGNRNVERERLYYNLDMIISLGYRIRSSIATQFRRWATERLKEYMIKGFAMDDERLKNLGGGSYWKELLDRIRDIRSSEKVMYRQVLDLYATSVDYDPKSAESVAFFKMVQNKLHYAAHGHTAAEVIFERADAEKPFMGLTAFSGDFPTAKDIAVAKNYLSADELKILNNLVSGYFDFAEIQAMRRRRGSAHRRGNRKPHAGDGAGKGGIQEISGAESFSRGGGIFADHSQHREGGKRGRKTLTLKCLHREVILFGPVYCGYG